MAEKISNHARTGDVNVIHQVKRGFSTHSDQKRISRVAVIHCCIWVPSIFWRVPKYNNEYFLPCIFAEM